MILLVHCIDSEDSLFLQFVLWYYLFTVLILRIVCFYSLYCDITCSLYWFWGLFLSAVCIAILLVHCIDSEDSLLLQFVLSYYLFTVLILKIVCFGSFYCDITCSLHWLWGLLITAVCIVILLVRCIVSNDCLLLQLYCNIICWLYWFWWLHVQFVLWYYLFIVSDYLFYSSKFLLWYYLFIVLILMTVYYCSLYFDIICLLCWLWWLFAT